VLLLTSLFSAQAQSNAADEAAIKAVVEAETRAWLTADVTTFKDCWQVHPYSRILVTTEKGEHFDVPTDGMKTLAAADMGSGGSFSNSNYRISVKGDMAWLTYDEVKTDKDGTQSPSHELRILEKVDGKWKIVGMSVHHYKP
jgi:hypothetical protein